MTEKTTAPARPGALIAVIGLHRRAAAIADDLDRLTAEHPDSDLRVTDAAVGLEVRLDGTPCGCHTCIAEDQKVRVDSGLYSWWTTLSIGMILCPECGNKRCPHATSHDQPCTGSNDPGQPGSRYA